MVCSLAGCATTENAQSIAAKTLLSSRQTVIAGATATDALCKQKILTPADCTKAAELYEQSQAAYNLASEAFLVAVQTGNAVDWKAYLVKEDTFKNVAGSAVACYNAFGGAK